MAARVDVAPRLERAPRPLAPVGAFRPVLLPLRVLAVPVARAPLVAPGLALVVAWQVSAPVASALLLPGAPAVTEAHPKVACHT